MPQVIGEALVSTCTLLIICSCKFNGPYLLLNKHIVIFRNAIPTLASPILFDNPPVVKYRRFMLPNAIKQS